MIRDTTGRQALASVNRRIESKRRRRRWRRTLARLTRRANATGEVRGALVFGGGDDRGWPITGCLMTVAYQERLLPSGPEGGEG